MSLLEKYLIHIDSPVRTALEHLDKFGGRFEQTLFVIDDDRKLKGTLTDGDIRRGLLKNISIDEKVSKVMNPDGFYLVQGEHTLEQVRKAQDNLIEVLPMVDADKRVVSLFNLSVFKTILPIDAVIMAGGEGKRLRPLTENTPKPLLKVGEKPIIEYNIDLLKKYGVQNVTLTVKYLGQQLVDTFGDGSNKDLNIGYVWENEPLGTIGSLSLVEEFHNDIVLVMNSDLLTNINLEELYEKFISTNAEMIVATVPYKVSVPYGIMEYEGDSIHSFREKPTYIYQANAGIYLIKKSALSLIPKGGFFNATDLMDALLKQDKKVSYFSILSYWLDIGKHEDFKKAQEDVGKIVL